jgi:hypothetical protein
MTTHPQTKPPTKSQKRLKARIDAFESAPKTDEQRRMMRKPGSQNHKK